MPGLEPSQIRLLIEDVRFLFVPINGNFPHATRRLLRKAHHAMRQLHVRELHRREVRSDVLAAWIDSSFLIGGLAGTAPGVLRSIPEGETALDAMRRLGGPAVQSLRFLTGSELDEVVELLLPGERPLV